MLKNTWHKDSKIVGVNYKSTDPEYSVESLKSILVEQFIPKQRSKDPNKFLFAVDHCFNIKGHGTVFTGTVVDGMISVKSLVNIPSTNESKKIKSIQVLFNLLKAHEI